MGNGLIEPASLGEHREHFVLFLCRRQIDRRTTIAITTTMPVATRSAPPTVTKPLKAETSNDFTHLALP
jgi:hypothetical protein